MSTRYNNGSHYENHERAAEMQEGAAHAHGVAEHQGKEEHLTGPEHSRQAQEHPEGVPPQHQAATAGHGIAAFGRAEIAARAHELWQARGCPEGSPEVDWLHAVEELRHEAWKPTLKH